MNEIWLVFYEVLKLEEISKRTFWRRFNTGGFLVRQYIDSTTGGRGGKQLQIGLSCLSAAAQDKYYLGIRGQGSGVSGSKEKEGPTPQAGTPAEAPAQSGLGSPAAAPQPVHIQVPPPFISPCAGDLSGQAAPPPAAADAGEVALAAALEQGSENRVQGSGVRGQGIQKHLTVKQEKTASLRYDLISLYKEAKAQARADKQSLQSASNEFVKLYNTGLPYPTIFAEVGEVAVGTLNKWESALKAANNNMNVLAPRHGLHRKGKRKVLDIEFQYCLRYALRPAQHPLEESIRLAKSHMAKDGFASPTSPATLRRALEDWRNKHFDRWIFCREGEKALNDKVLPYIERDSSLINVGDVLVVDGHTLNFQVLNPYSGKPGRATLLMFFDWASRYPAGWYIMMSENTQCVHAALRRAIINLGKIPSFCYLDNGKAFRGKYFNGVKDFKECGFEGLYGRLGIKAVFAKPYNAQTKVIERYFGTFAELERLMPSYSGTSIGNKPAHMMRNERLHKSLHSGFLPSIQQSDLLVQTWLEQEYGMRPHRGLQMRCPLEIWNEGKGPGVDEGLLWALMLSKEIKKVDRNGISWLGLDWFDDALYGLKDRVMIRYDISDLSKIFVFTPDGSELICEARPVQKLHPMAALSDNPFDLKAVQDANRAKARHKKSTERDYRAYATDINWKFPGQEKEEPRELTRPEIEDIEAAAAQCQVIDITPALPEGRPLFGDETEKYEWLCKQQAQGTAMAHEDLAFMNEFEGTEQYLQLQGYFQRIRQAQ